MTSVDTANTHASASHAGKGITVSVNASGPASTDPFADGAGDTTQFHLMVDSLIHEQDETVGDKSALNPMKDQTGIQANNQANQASESDSADGILVEAAGTGKTAVSVSDASDAAQPQITAPTTPDDLSATPDAETNSAAKTTLTESAQPILLNGTQLIVIPQATLPQATLPQAKLPQAKIQNANPSVTNAAIVAKKDTSDAQVNTAASSTDASDTDANISVVVSTPVIKNNLPQAQTKHGTEKDAADMANPAAGQSGSDNISQAAALLTAALQVQQTPALAGEPSGPLPQPTNAKKVSATIVSTGSELSLYGALALPAGQGAQTAVIAPATSKTTLTANSAGAPLASADSDDDASVDASITGKADLSATPGAAQDVEAGTNASNQGTSSGNGEAGNDNNPAKAQDFAQLLQADTSVKGKSGATEAAAPASFADTVKSAPLNSFSGSESTPIVQAGATSSGFATSFTQPGSSSALTYVQATPEQVSVVLQHAASQQVQSMTIALDPVELGKVQVKLNFGKDGTVQASVTADRAETLSMLKNNHGALTEALQNAGLSPDSSSLNFSLSGQGQQQAQQDANASSRHREFNFEAAVPATTQTAHSLQASSNGRVDLLV